MIICLYLDLQTLSKVRESLVLARGGGTPLLEEFDDSPSYWYPYIPQKRHIHVMHTIQPL